MGFQSHGFITKSQTSACLPVCLTAAAAVDCIALLSQGRAERRQQRSDQVILSKHPTHVVTLIILRLIRKIGVRKRDVTVLIVPY